MQERSEERGWHRCASEERSPGPKSCSPPGCMGFDTQLDGQTRALQWDTAGNEISRCSKTSDRRPSLQHSSSKGASMLPAPNEQYLLIPRGWHSYIVEATKQQNKYPLFTHKWKKKRQNPQTDLQILSLWRWLHTPSLPLAQTAHFTVLSHNQAYCSVKNHTRFCSARASLTSELSNHKFQV